MAYFFCGIGGSGMLPLALILKAQGEVVHGSDRSRDQGKTPEKFFFLESSGIPLFPQDGSGPAPGDTLVVSTAVEESIPDVGTARKLGLPILKRAELLARCVNSEKERVVIAGTSGKTTVTGMTGYLLRELGHNPTVMNGGIFRNYVRDNPFCCAFTGKAGLFVTEADESDGSISLYNPSVAILTNISLDHVSLDELHQLFSAFLAKAPQAVLNLDDAGVAKLAADYKGKALTFSLGDATTDLCAENISLRPDGSDCTVKGVSLSLQVPGKHNIANALAALGAALQLGLSLEDCCKVLAGFQGIRRRLEVVGTANGITVIDDFGHNPDKIAATLVALRAFPGRLVVMFQPHGFGPLRLMRKELAESFQNRLGPEDLLFMPEPYYAGGTVDRSVTSRHLVEDLQQAGMKAEVLPDRAACKAPILAAAKPGDRILVMGARDDTLSDFARELLAGLSRP